MTQVLCEVNILQKLGTSPSILSKYVLLRFVIGLKSLRHSLNQSEAKPNPSWLTRALVPAFDADYIMAPTQAFSSAPLSTSGLKKPLKPRD